MAFSTLQDRVHSFNSSRCHSSFSQADWQDFIEDSLAKSKALLQIGMIQGIHQCPESAQFYYLAILDELLELIHQGFEHLQVA